MYNLLDDRFIRVTLDDGSESHCTLPEIFERFADDSIRDFSALRAHQRAAWHMLLAQIGAIAARAAGRMPVSATDWREALLDIAPPHAWDLIGEDHTLPAFLQCPVTVPLEGYQRSPGAVDILITSKNHAIKADLGLDAEVQDWLFALVARQTMSNYGGSGNYAISRLKGAESSRPFVGLKPEGNVGSHVLRDIRVMQQHRAAVIAARGFREDGIFLLWLEPWDGSTQIEMAELDPWYIEICRIIRLEWSGSKIHALTATSGKSRVMSKEMNGVTGDHWCPIEKGKAASFEPGEQGFDAQTVCDLLFGGKDKAKFELPASLTFLPGDRKMTVVLRAMVTGKGVTKGYSEREIPLRSSFVRLASDVWSGAIAEHAANHLKEIREAGQAMEEAILSFLTGGDRAAMKSPSSPLRRETDRILAPLKRKFNREADGEFFENIQARLEDPGAEIGQMRRLVQRARGIVLESLENLPAPAMRKHKSIAAAVRTVSASFRSGRGRIASNIDRISPNGGREIMESMDGNQYD